MEERGRRGPERQGFELPGIESQSYVGTALPSAQTAGRHHTSGV